MSTDQKVTKPAVDKASTEASKEKAAPKAAEVKKVDQKTTKKVAKKAAKKVAKKAAKKASKKVVKKPVTAPAKASKKAKTVKKATKNVTKKAAKPAAKDSDNRLQYLQELLQENIKDINTDKAEAVAKNIWLAGLGAYAKTFNELSERYDDLQDKYEAINQDGQKVFDDLIKKGESIQNEMGETVQKGRDSIETRVDEFRKRFGGGLSSFIDIPARLRDAAEKIEELGEKLQKKK